MPALLLWFSPEMPPGLLLWGGGRELLILAGHGGRFDFEHLALGDRHGVTVGVLVVISGPFQLRLVGALNLCTVAQFHHIGRRAAG